MPEVPYMRSPHSGPTSFGSAISMEGMRNLGKDVGGIAGGLYQGIKVRGITSQGKWFSQLANEDQAYLIKNDPQLAVVMQDDEKEEKAFVADLIDVTMNPMAAIQYARDTGTGPFAGVPKSEWDAVENDEVRDVLAGMRAQIAKAEGMEQVVAELGGTLSAIDQSGTPRLLSAQGVIEKAVESGEFAGWHKQNLARGNAILQDPNGPYQRKVKKTVRTFPNTEDPVDKAMASLSGDTTLADAPVAALIPALTGGRQSWQDQTEKTFYERVAGAHLDRWGFPRIGASAANQGMGEDLNLGGDAPPVAAAPAPTVDAAAVPAEGQPEAPPDTGVFNGQPTPEAADAAWTAGEADARARAAARTAGPAEPAQGGGVVDDIKGVARNVLGGGPHIPPPSASHYGRQVGEAVQGIAKEEIADAAQGLKRLTPNPQVPLPTAGDAARAVRDVAGDAANWVVKTAQRAWEFSKDAWNGEEGKQAASNAVTYLERFSGANGTEHDLLALAQIASRRGQDTVNDVIDKAATANPALAKTVAPKVVSSLVRRGQQVPMVKGFVPDDILNDKTIQRALKSKSVIGIAREGSDGRVYSVAKGGLYASFAPNELQPGMTIKGRATWYQQDGHARKKTASGDTFDDTKMAAASKRWPMGSRLKVTNPRTGQSVTVIVNDRGPWQSKHRQAGDVNDLDLTKAAAQAIAHNGNEQVSVQYLGRGKQ